MTDYRDIDSLRVWEKNKEVRSISPNNYAKLKRSIQKYGVKDAFSIDKDGLIYDGGNRYAVLEELIAQGILESDNHKELRNVPVQVYEFDSDSQKWDLMLRKGQGYARFNDKLGNYTPEFDNLDLDDINMQFKDPVGFYELFPNLQVNEVVATETEETETKTEKSNPKEKKIITCPECGFEFNV